MIYSKVFALSLLLVSPFALARVNLNTNMEINHPFPTQTIAAENQLDVKESAVVYDANNMRVEAELLAEQENDALVRYTISAKNAEGAYEVIAAPELCATYGKTATLSIGQKSEQTEQVDSFKITLEVSKS